MNSLHGSAILSEPDELFAFGEAIAKDSGTTTKDKGSANISSFTILGSLNLDSLSLDARLAIAFELTTTSRPTSAITYIETNL